MSQSHFSKKMQREHLSNHTSSMLLQEHAKHLLSLMDKTDASRNALEYFEWCQDVEYFTDNSTGTRNFQGQSVARSHGSLTTAGNTQKVNDSHDFDHKERQMKCDRRNGSTNSSIAHNTSFNTSSLVPTRDISYNNDKGTFKEVAFLKWPETYRYHTDFHSSSCGSSYLSTTSEENNYCLPSTPYQSPYQSTCSNSSLSIHSSSSSSSSLGSCEEYKKPKENWRTTGHDSIDERLINYYQQGPAKHQYQTSNAPTIGHSSHDSITSALNDLCDCGDFSLQNMEW